MNITGLPESKDSPFGCFWKEPAFDVSPFDDSPTFHVLAISSTFLPIFTTCAHNQEFSCVESY